MYDSSIESVRLQLMKQPTYFNFFIGAFEYFDIDCGSNLVDVNWLFLMSDKTDVELFEQHVEAYQYLQHRESMKHKNANSVHSMTKLNSLNSAEGYKVITTNGGKLAPQHPNQILFENESYGMGNDKAQASQMMVSVFDGVGRLLINP